VDICY
jgi:hypothetical protein